jgi:hypothetical protein
MNPFTVNPSGQALQDKSVQDESVTNKGLGSVSSLVL